MIQARTRGKASLRPSSGAHSGSRDTQGLEVGGGGGGGGGGGFVVTLEAKWNRVGEACLI